MVTPCTSAAYRKLRRLAPRTHHRFTGYRPGKVVSPPWAQPSRGVPRARRGARVRARCRPRCDVRLASSAANAVFAACPASIIARNNSISGATVPVRSRIGAFRSRTTPIRGRTAAVPSATAPVPSRTVAVSPRTVAMRDRTALVPGGSALLPGGRVVMSGARRAIAPQRCVAHSGRLGRSARVSLGGDRGGAIMARVVRNRPRGLIRGGRAVGRGSTDGGEEPPDRRHRTRENARPAPARRAT